jgi:predicted metal-dependent phosphoesterase TrpH
MDDKIYYDLHIHTALSPCGDELMTPNNIVGMAAIKELGCIAVTDHNTAGNAASVIKAAARSAPGLIVVPGMELETSEEVHVVCLFPELEALLRFEEFVDGRLPRVKNRKDIFGEQQYLDEWDEVIGEKENLLLVATTIGLYEAVEAVKKYGGIAIPAHIDRPGNGLLATLGFLPPDLDVNLIEISKANDPEAFIIHHKKELARENIAFVQSSDAHYLENISERERYLRISGPKNAKSVIETLKNR